MKKLILGFALLLNGLVSAQDYGQFGMFYSKAPDDSNSFPLGLMMNSGWFITNHLGIGVTGKLHAAAGAAYSIGVTPRFNMIEGGFSPYLSLTLGYAKNNSFNANEAYELRKQSYPLYNVNSNLPTSGMYYEPTFGLRLGFVAFSVSYPIYFNKFSELKKFSYLSFGFSLEYGYEAQRNSRRDRKQKRKLEDLDKQVEEELRKREEREKTNNI
jgi:hypothetical protein